MKELFFGFDVGEGSLGVAVREGEQVKHAASFLIEPDHGRSSQSRERRGAHRTRKSHLKREKFLHNIWSKIGKEPLDGDGASEENKARLHREFAKNDSEVYNSSVLRVMLLEEKPLKDWQVYKALRSAIQKRGYDKDVPWKTDSDSTEAKKDKKKTEASMKEFEEELEAIPDENKRLPCYYNVLKMGFWTKEKGLLLGAERNSDRHLKSPAKPYVAPRELVEKELRLLVEAAKKQVPELAAFDTEEILYGPAKKAYTSPKKVEGLLGQKVPRFDNRCVHECALLPHYKVARPDLLFASFVFLQKLHNFRFSGPDGEARFNLEDLQQFHNKAKDEAKKAMAKGLDPKQDNDLKKLFAKFKFTTTQLKNIVAARGNVFAEREPSLLAGHNEIAAPKASGRTRYSRPALRFLRRLYLSGKAPAVFWGEELARTEEQLKDPSLSKKERRKLEATKRDLAVLQGRSMGESWEKIHIPDVPFSEQVKKDGTTKSPAEQILETCRNGVVRHRVEFLYKKYKELIKEFGEPTQVNVEFIREDFIGEKAKAKLIKSQNENRKKNEQVRKDMGDAGGFLKHKLHREQAGKCLYTGKSLGADQLKSGALDIDHIVPRSKGGNDAHYNKVLTTREVNRELKKNQTPYEWLRNSGKWDAYVERVEKANIGDRKKKILTSENPIELIEKYTALADTSYIARLCRDVLYAHHGKVLGAKDEKKFIHVISGKITAIIRRQNGLNKELGEKTDDDSDFDRDKKDRSDKRHHALDAMVLTYAGEWMRDPNKAKEFNYNKLRLSEEKRRSIVEQLNKVVPETVVPRKSAIGETYYAKRTIVDDEGKSKEVLVSRKPLIGLVEKEKDLDKIIDKGLRNSIKERLMEHVIEPLREQYIDETHDNYQEEFKKAFSEEFESGRQGRSIVKKVACVESDNLKIYKNVSKSKTDRGQYVTDKSVMGTGTYTKGKFIYRDNKNKVQVRSIHAFERIHDVKKQIESECDEPWIPGIGSAVIQSGVTVFRLHKDYTDSRGTVPAGLYTLKSIIEASGQVQLLGPKGEVRGHFGIGKLIDDCGLDVYFPK